VDDCEGMFSSIGYLARHMTAAAGMTHRTWRREHGLDDKGMADDEQWKQIANKLKDNL